MLRRTCGDAHATNPFLSTLPTPHSTLHTPLSKMGFVKNVTNWSDKTQVRNSLAMCEIDWKTRRFCDFGERQKSGFCPLQSCWLFRGQNGQNKSRAISDHPSSSMTLLFGDGHRRAVWHNGDVCRLPKTRQGPFCPVIRSVRGNWHTKCNLPLSILPPPMRCPATGVLSPDSGRWRRFRGRPM